MFTCGPISTSTCRHFKLRSTRRAPLRTRGVRMRVRRENGGGAGGESGSCGPGAPTRVKSPAVRGCALAGVILALGGGRALSAGGTTWRKGEGRDRDGIGNGAGRRRGGQLADLGWNIVVNYTRSKKEADETLAAVKAKGVEAILVQADVGQDADCRKLVEEAMKEWGRIDGVINNAGTTKFQYRATSRASRRGFRPHHAGQRRRPLQMSRAVFPAMKKQWEENRSAARS